MAQPVAYIRRSLRSRSDPGDVSREFQTDTVRALAGPDGPALRVVDDDWGKSGATDKTDKRNGFLGVLSQIERGEVTALFAYSTDRLARSVEWSARLLNACRRAGTVIVTSEGRFEPDNPMTDQLFYFQAMQNEGYSSQARQKRLATVAKLRQNGVKMGPPYYGDLPGEDRAAVVAAFDVAGSAHGAARRLNQAMQDDPEHAARPRRAGSWTDATVRQVLVREGRVYPHGKRGTKPRGTFRLSQLLRCGGRAFDENGNETVCGKTLSGVKRPKAPWPIYRCVTSQADPRHGVKSVSEARLMDWVKAEAGRWQAPGTHAQEGGDSAARRAAITEDRRKLYLAFSRGVFDDAEYEAEDQRLADALRDLDAGGVIRPIVDIDWDRFAPEDVNDILREMWRSIKLGPDLLPVEADWRVKP